MRTTEKSESSSFVNLVCRFKNDQFRCASCFSLYTRMHALQIPNTIIVVNCNILGIFHWDLWFKQSAFSRFFYSNNICNASNAECLRSAWYRHKHASSVCCRWWNTPLKLQRLLYMKIINCLHLINGKR